LVEEQLLTWQEVSEMSEGGMTFGGHTVDHSILTRSPLEEAKWQISKSKERIEKEIGKEISSFAYPNGTPEDYNTEISEYLRSAGFIAAFTTSPILYKAGGDTMTIGRIGVPDDENLFNALISGFPGDLGRISSLPYRFFQNEYVRSENARFFHLISQ
jgi:peptidoglycan/xylan/chitin deacetylase (PgdA/CDA1 family)